MKRLSFNEMMFSLKATAAREVSLAKAAKIITVPNSCSKCGKVGKVEGHHQNYARPLELEWLCKVCHALADKVRRDREQIIFKDMIEEDTKEALKQYAENW